VYVASDNFPRNHRLGPGDLALDTLLVARPDTALVVGKYLACALAKKGAVRRQDLRGAPELRPAQGRHPYLMSLDAEPALKTMLNAGSRVDVWDDESAVVESALVTALLCRGSKDSTCVVAIDVSADERAALAKSAAKARRIIVREVKP
jgi:hypothetical protein